MSGQHNGALTLFKGGGVGELAPNSSWGEMPAPSSQPVVVGRAGPEVKKAGLAPHPLQHLGAWPLQLALETLELALMV